MGDAKRLDIRPIDGRTASEFIAAHHYSGKAVKNSTIHLGVHYAGSLEGVLQFGMPIVKRAMLPLVRGSNWDSMLELNRLAFTDRLPRNSESRALAVTFRLLRKHAPQVKWVLSFADATQCGDGTIYRAAGFVLTDVRPNQHLARLPDGTVIHDMRLKSAPTKPRPELGGRSLFDLTGGTYSWRAYLEASGAEVIPGWQLRYIYFVDPAWRSRLTVPEIPYDRISEVGATMYRGKAGRGSADSGAPPNQGEGAVQVRPHGSTS